MVPESFTAQGLTLCACSSLAFPRHWAVEMLLSFTLLSPLHCLIYSFVLSRVKQVNSAQSVETQDSKETPRSSHSSRYRNQSHDELHGKQGSGLRSPLGMRGCEAGCQWNKGVK